MSESTAVVQVVESVELGIIRGSQPAELVRRATDAANELARIIKTKQLFSRINGKEFVRCEGWTTLAMMMGCLPVEVSCEKDEDGTYIAVVELRRMSDGQMLTRASAECGMDEPTWKSRSSYARRSMAITRATSKACRIAFSWIMVLAGYQPTPAEEIPDEDERPVVHTKAERADTGQRGESRTESPARAASPKLEKGFNLAGEAVAIFSKPDSPLAGQPLSRLTDQQLTDMFMLAGKKEGYTAWREAAEKEQARRVRAVPTSQKPKALRDTDEDRELDERMELPPTQADFKEPV